MKVEDIVMIVGRELDLPTVVDYCTHGATSSTTQETIDLVNKLTTLTNLVISELATSYIPAVILESVTPQDNKVYFANLTKTPLRILEVLDSNSKPINYTSEGTYLTGIDIKKIKYEYMPSDCTLNQNVAYTDDVVSRYTLADGVSAEYCLTAGMFDEAIMWRTRYVDKIKEMAKLKNVKIKGRDFI